MRQCKQLIQINLFRDSFPNLFNFGCRNMRFIAGHQSEMALNNTETLVVMNRPDHRHISVMLDDGAQLGLMSTAAKIIQDHSGNVDVTIKCLITKDQWRDAARHPACIDHQHYRQIKQLGQCGIAVAAVQGEAVV